MGDLAAQKPRQRAVLPYPCRVRLCEREEGTNRCRACRRPIFSIWLATSGEQDLVLPAFLPHLEVIS